MKAIIMAAGVGSRLKKHLGNLPKCCTKIGNETLIERMMGVLAAKGVTDVVLVLGYQHQAVVERLAGRWPVRIYINPFFSITNSIASLWFAREELDGQDDVMILNGDLFFEPELLTRILGVKEEAVMFADPRRVVEADYRFN